MIAALLAVTVGGSAGAYALMSEEKRGGAAEPPVRIADTIFAPARNALSDGRIQQINDVAAEGRVVVAAGSEEGSNTRPRFLVSTDAGRTWRVGKVTAEGGGGLLDATPQKIVGTAGGWLALSTPGLKTTAWTSQNGRSWVQLKDTINAFRTGDDVRRLDREGQTYAAVGSDQAGQPVLWLSADGREWDRVDGSGLKLPVKGRKERIRRLNYVAAEDQTLLLSGDVLSAKRLRAAAWRSTDNGRTWQVADGPTASGAFGTLHVAADSAKFFALRKSVDGSKGIVFESLDAQSWQVRGSIPLPPGQSQEFVDLTAGSQELGVVTTGPDRSATLYHSRDGGASWRKSGVLRSDPSRTVRGMAVANGNVTVGGYLRRKSGQDFYLAVASGTGEPDTVDLSKVRDAINPERSVQDLGVVDGRRVVAVGSTNADAAAWTSADGRTWRRADTSTLGGDGTQQFTDLAHGVSGWLTIGSDQQRPLLATSANGTAWRRVEDPSFVVGGEQVSFAAAASGPKGYVLLGSAGDTSVAWASPDLRSWRSSGKGLAPAKGSTQNVADVAGTTAGYVAVGEVQYQAASPARGKARGRAKKRAKRRVNTQPQPAVWTSEDGLTWKAKRLPLPKGATAGGLTNVAVRGTTVVAAGAGDIDGSRAFVLVSEDSGTTWKSDQLPLPVAGATSDLSAVTATDTGFAAAGNLDGPAEGDVLLWTSTDGKAWAVANPQVAGLYGPGLQRMVSLAGVQGHILGVGLTTDAQTEHLTLWRGPAG